MAATFSYAQAAKGEAMSRSGSQESSTLQQTETSQNQHVPERQEKKKILGLSLETSKSKTQSQIESSPVQDLPMNNSHVDQSQESPKSTAPKVEQPGAISPNESVSTVSKSFGNGENSSAGAVLQSNWEKGSQDSLSDQAAGNADDDSTTTKSSTADQARPQMKEAPVPVFNVWQKRMEVAQAKTPKSTPRTVSSEHPASSNNTHVEASHLQGKAPASVRLSGPTTAAIPQRMAKPAQNGSSAISVPPPSSDVSLWPTPDLAKVEEKKKEVEVSDHDKPATKSHTKEKWEKIAFVPTAVFNTPLPTRGGARGGRAGGRGGRDSISRGGSVSAIAGSTTDRSVLSNGIEGQDVASHGIEHPKFRDSNSTRGGAVQKTKRSSSTGTHGFQENGQNNDGVFEKRDSIGHRTFSNQRNMEHRRTSTSTQTDSGGFNGRSYNAGDTNGESRFGRSERSFQPRSGAESNTYFPPRERGEGRPERGSRGNWRSGKPGPSSYGSFGSGTHQQNHGYTNGKPYNEQRHNSHPTPFGNGREPRHNRGNSRSQSIPNSQAPGRFAAQTVGINGLPSLQTDMVNTYPYGQPTTVMSAVPFQSYMEQVQLPAMLQMQLEYYLSVDNLCKDIFLRKNMDGQGFVFLHVLQSFNRIQTLTTDANLIKWVCSRSPLIELCTGADGYDRVRRAEDWQQWVLPVEERDPSAQTDGPTYLLTPQFDGFVNGFDMSPLAFQQNHQMSPINSNMINGYRGEFIPESFDQYNHFEPEPVVKTPLTANVPDFKPVHAIQNQYVQPQGRVEFEDKFPDSGFKSLNILVKGSKDEQDSVAPTLVDQSTTSSKSDNGSDKENQKSQDIASTTNEGHANGVAQHISHTQELPNSPTGRGESDAEQTLQQITWISSTDSSVPGESYQAFRSHALDQRDNTMSGHCPDAMVDLYEFWSLFLVDNFNTKAYQEFHSTALEDANLKQSLVGLRHLVVYYSRCLSNDKAVADQLLHDFVDLAAVEFANGRLAKERPVLNQLHNLWKVGFSHSINHFNLSNMLTGPLRNALEQGEFAPVP